MLLDKLKIELIEQKKSKFKGNIYHYSQVNFAYNSNKIEGSKLTENETEEIFETNSYIPKSDDIVKLDDLTEKIKIHYLTLFLLSYSIATNLKSSLTLT